MIIMWRSFLQIYNNYSTIRFFVKYVLMLIFIAVLFSVGLILFDGYSLSDSAWLIWQTITTVGYGDIPPKTILGRVMVMLLGTAGLGLLGTVISGLFEVYQFIKLQWRMGMKKNPFNGGYVFVNFPGKVTVEYFLREIRAKEKDAPLCIIDSQIEELPKWLQLKKNIHFVKGNTIRQETYRQANVANSKMVVVFPSNPGVSDSDALSAVIVENVNKLKGPNTRVAHIIVDPDNAHLFEDKGSVQILETLEILALVNECQDKHTAATFEHLLLNTEGANPISIENHSMAGIRWIDFQLACIRVSAEQEANVNPFALVQKGEIPSANPSPETVIEEDDVIILIADPGFHYPDFEKFLLENIKRQETKNI